MVRWRGNLIAPRGAPEELKKEKGTQEPSAAREDYCMVLTKMVQAIQSSRLQGGPEEAADQENEILHGTLSGVRPDQRSVSA